MVTRYAEFRIDAGSIQELADGSIKVIGQLTRPGIFSYRNPDGSERREYRSPEEVFKPESMRSFANLALTVNHPAMPDGARLVTAANRKAVAVGHVGDSVRQDGENMVADMVIWDQAAIDRVRSGDLKHLSCGYRLDYVPGEGVTPRGERYDGMQTNMRGNHVALLSRNNPPRGGESCVLRLDSAGDEILSDPTNNKSDLNSGILDPKELEKLNTQITVLTAELEKARTDAADVAKLRNDLTAAQARVKELEGQLAPERLDALVADRESVAARAKAEGIDPAGKSSVAIKRMIVAKRTPALAARVDSLSIESLDVAFAAYAAEPHPSMAAVVAPVVDAVKVAEAARTDSDKVPTYQDLQNKFNDWSRNAWKGNGDNPNRQVEIR